MDNLDWTLMRSFLAVADTGSLSAAARALGLSQPSLSRHIAEAERQVGDALFLRQPRGLTPTALGLALLPHARAMADAAARAALAIAGRDSATRGTVRVTASCIASAHLLPPMLAALHAQAPGIQIELVPSDRPENLFYREADIAIRMFRPEEPDLITAHVTDLAMGLYASNGYVAARGMPTAADALARHEFLGFDRSDRIIQMMAGLGIKAERADFWLRCDDQLVYWAMVRAGLGIGGMQRVIGNADPLVTPVLQDVTLPALPVWLTAHSALREVPRIRLVFDHLRAGFRALGRVVG
jgi:DNA-binding transcriptional LysR family regulator